ncbi:HAD family hydrolase [Paenibacillus sp. DMB20]|uniref:HAD family hydrolase n=1 Tax=Paenibacillus sp. DMB20 TaxID=1642570 RepID=UPI002286613F|nr:HAD hydrolase-like protein [Paenibacillus sp. DMB20]
MLEPDRQIFELMLKELKVRPEEALYIGDSLRDDYEGARGAGIDFCLYRGRDQVLEAHQKRRIL